MASKHIAANIDRRQEPEILRHSNGVIQPNPDQPVGAGLQIFSQIQAAAEDATAICAAVLKKKEIGKLSLLLRRKSDVLANSLHMVADKATQGVQQTMWVGVGGLFNGLRAGGTLRDNRLETTFMIMSKAVIELAYALKYSAKLRTIFDREKVSVALNRLVRQFNRMIERLVGTISNNRVERLSHGISLLESAAVDWALKLSAAKKRDSLRFAPSA